MPCPARPGLALPRRAKPRPAIPGVGGVDQLIEATSDGGTLRFVNRNELAKSYIQLKKDIEEKLKNLVNAYKHNSYVPLSVEGDDTNVDITSSRIGSNAIVGLSTYSGR